MAKRKKPRKKKKSLFKRRVVAPGQMNINAEAKYIIKRAQNHDARIVNLGPLVFFSTETGDAWMLDPEDGFALCLARSGEEQTYNIDDTPDNFSIEWNADYRIEGEAFIVASRKSGQVKTILGYPTEQILYHIRMIR